MPELWINEEFVDAENAKVGVDDAGLLHAAGVFTTFRARNGKIEWLDRHLDRVASSCQALLLPLRYDRKKLGDVANELLVRNELTDARMRLTVTRGSTSIDPVQGEIAHPTVFMTAARLAPYPPEFYEKGLTVILESDQKLNPWDFQAGHKTLDYFSRLTSLRSAVKRQAGESLWFNVHNFLQSGSISNVHIVEATDDAPVLVTPPTNEDLREEVVKRSCPYPKSNVLPGVTRGRVLEAAARAGISVHRLPIDVNRLLAAREVFLSNSIMGVMPVTKIEQHDVGDGKPGPMSEQLRVALDEMSP